MRMVYKIAFKKFKSNVFLFADLLQDELTREEDSVRDVVYLCLAGLKQVCILYVYFKSNQVSYDPRIEQFSYDRRK